MYKTIKYMILGFVFALVAGILGEIIQSITSINDFQRGVITGFLCSIIFYLYISDVKKNASE